MRRRPPPRVVILAGSTPLAALLLAAACGTDGAVAPCAGVDCSGHGTCHTDGFWPLCACDPGYRPAGAACVPDGDAGDAGDVADDGGTTDGADAEETVADGAPCDPGGGDDRCEGGVLLRCRVDGSGFAEIPCPFGCAPTGVRCGDLVVPNVTDEALIESGTGVLEPGGSAAPFVVIDTDTGAITSHDAAGATVRSLRLPIEGLDPVSGVMFATQAQGAGQPGLGIFAMASLTVPRSTW